MNALDAKKLAASIIGPCGRLGHFVGRGEWWPSESHLTQGKQAIGRVMASGYFLLQPIWAQHPDLDPSKSSDPLDLPGLPACQSRDTPAILLSLLKEFRTAVAQGLDVLRQDASPEASAHYTREATEAFEAADSAESLIGGMKADPKLNR